MKPSEVKYNVKVLKNVLIPMRDGVHLAADMYLPDAPGKFPAVMTYIHAHKDGWSNFWMPKESSELAQNGYVYVVVDIRGTGSSGGASLGPNTFQQWEDGYDAIEWISQQPWCNGNVGMWGLSYAGNTTLNIATLNPPHLKAIVPSECDINWFDHTHPGGALRCLLIPESYTWCTGLTFLPPLYTDEEGRWLKIWNYHLEHNESWLLSSYEHPVEDDFTREASASYRLDKIKAATYYIGAWRDFFPQPPFVLYNSVKAPKKLLMGPWFHGQPDAATPGPNIDYLNELIRWFDYWLKGIDNGIMDEPPITIWVEDPGKWRVQNDKPIAGGKWRCENEWPIARRKETVFHLHPEGALESKPYEGKEESDSFDHKATAGTTRCIDLACGTMGLPLDQRADEALSLTYTTQPLSEDTEIAGAPILKLFASTSADVGVFVAKLNDVSPDGSSAAITYANLNVALRESHEKDLPVKSGEVYELTIKLWDTSYLVKAGHRLRLAIASSDFPFVWPTTKAAVNTVYHSQKYPSHIVIPFVPEQRSALPAPTLREVPPPSQLPPTRVYFKRYRRIERDIKRDPAASTVTVYYGREEKVILSPKTTVELFRNLKVVASDIAPADTTVTTESRYDIEGHKLGTVNVRVNTIATSKTVHEVVNITVNGLLVFSKRWTRP